MVDFLREFRIGEDFRGHIDKVLNLHFFRKLSGKTQVILSLAGPTVRTRLTHTVEVARIARKLCNDLELNADLGEVIALAHDLGHTPFGHVGERALKEIMCGCDTLKGKINETDFNNSGFKHNLQSFRVLCTLEAVSDHDTKWPYILWGVPAHSSMTWSKSYFGMHNEILISCKHCDSVYSCFFHEKRECKRNIQIKRKVEGEKKPKLCRPSFCAKLDTFEDRHDIPLDFLGPGDKREDFLGWFRDSTQVYCSRPCYLAELSEFKGKHRAAVTMFPYLFDHPFPNSFYGSHFLSYFGDDKDFISVEAQVVSQADEIAQRQQDLEDAVSTELISFEIAQNDVEKLVREKVAVSNQKDLGEIIVAFYSKHLVQTTLSNFKEFSSKTKTNLNIYCLMNLLFMLNHDKDGRLLWIIEQIKQMQRGEELSPIPTLEEVFYMNYDKGYLYFLIYDILEIDARFGNFNASKKILPELSKNMPTIAIGDANAGNAELISGIDRLGDAIQKDFGAKFLQPRQNDSANYWKNISWFNLYHFHVLSQIGMELLKKDEPQTRGFYVIDDLRSIDIKTLATSYKAKKTFPLWKQVLKADANKVLANLVMLTNDEKQAKLFDEFKEKQKNYILKSELVEKNDGKANYILKRLFSAFITNSHQLPDDGLKFILLTLTDQNILSDFLNNEQETFLRLLGKLEKTAPYGFAEIDAKMKKNLLQLRVDDFESIVSSNEIKALTEKRKDLWEFLWCFVSEMKAHFNVWIRSEIAADKIELEMACLKFRRILDNPILNAMPFWKSLLTRGICDFIASRTDQEAIDQYEKLYASVMELI